MDAIYADSSWQSTKGKVLVYFRKDSLSSLLKYGDRLMFKGSPDSIKGPKNPGAFDYRQYMALKDIHHQQFVDADRYQLLSRSEGNAFYAHALSIRSWAVQTFKDKIADEQSAAIVSALVLGAKSDLSDDVKQAYATAGAMHVLAVSGLHVGIIYMIILAVFGKLQGSKRGKTLLVLISLMLLWSYAMITGFSPSVLRAATMFSFMAVGKAFNRNSNIYNAIFASAFVLLCIDPHLLMSVGFQLSYSAVIGIVYLQPRIEGWFSSSNWLLNKVWSITSVTLAAQCATLPLSLYYFNQFPTYFLVSNLIVIYAATIILCAGLLVLVTSFITVITDFLGMVLSHLVSWLNTFIFWIESWPMSRLKGLYIDMWQTLLVATILVLIIKLFVHRRFRSLKSVLIVTCLFAGYSFYGILKQQSRQRIIFYDIKKSSNLELVQGFDAQLFMDSTTMTDQNSMAYNITPLHQKWGLNAKLTASTSYFASPKNSRAVEFTIWDGLKLARISQPLKTLEGNGGKTEVDVIVIAGNAVKSLDAITALFEAKLIVIDSSNSFKVSRSLKRQADLAHIPVHSVLLDGALILDPETLSL